RLQHEACPTSAPPTITESANLRSPSLSGLAKAPQRLADLSPPGLKLALPLARFFQHVFRSLGDETRIVEATADRRDVLGDLVEFFAEPRPFGGEIDDPFERQGDGRFAKHDLCRRPRHGFF